MSPKPTSTVVDAVKDTKVARDSVRSKKLAGKGQDRSKAVAKHVRGVTTTVGAHKPSAGPAGGRSKRRGYAILEQEDLGFAPLHAIKSRSDDDRSGTSSSDDSSDGGAVTDHSGPIEVPLLTIIRTPHPWDGVGADFELVSNPGEVIALDNEDFDADEDDDWENIINEFGPKTKNKGPSYAAALKANLHAN